MVDAGLKPSGQVGMWESTSYVTAFEDDDRVVVTIADDPAAAAAIAAAASACGARVAARVGLAQAADRLAMQARLHVVALDLGLADERAAMLALDAAADAARVHGAFVIASFGPEHIDMAAAALAGVDAELLCDPAPAERVAAFATIAPPGLYLNDAARDAERQRLRHLNDEVARIAQTLARLARAEPPLAPLGLAEPGSSYRGPMLTDGSMAIDAGHVRGAIRARRMRAQFFDSGLFADPAWDMLLDLFAAHLEHVRVSVSSLCIAAAVPPTTALRWITTMREAGLVQRHDDPFDRRRAYVTLTDTAVGAMKRYCTALSQAGLAVP